MNATPQTWTPELFVRKQIAELLGWTRLRSVPSMDIPGIELYGCPHHTNPNRSPQVPRYEESLDVLQPLLESLKDTDRVCFWDNLSAMVLEQEVDEVPYERLCDVAIAPAFLKAKAFLLVHGRAITPMESARPKESTSFPPCCRCGRPIDWCMTEEQRIQDRPYSDNPICTPCFTELAP